MGAFSVALAIAGLGLDDFEEFVCTVDVSSMYTWLPADRLNRLGVKPTEPSSFQRADGTAVDCGAAWLSVRLEGAKGQALIMFGAPGSEPVLGALTLEELGLSVDAANERLERRPARLTGYRLL